MVRQHTGLRRQRYQCRVQRCICHIPLCFYLIVGLLACLPLTTLAKGSLPPQETTPMKPEQLFASAQCPVASAGADVSNQWITTQAQLDRLYVQLNSHIVGDNKPAAPKLDFITSGVLLLHMGQKNTGGYGLQLPAQELVIKDATAVLRVKWMEPEAGAMVMQVLTSPCMLVRMPLGDYRRIEVVDQNNKTRTSLTL